MSESPEVEQLLRRHRAVWLALAIGTAMLVASHYLPLGSPAAKIGFGLAVALTQAFLVVAHLMHLLTERRTIFLSLGLTAVFLACVLLLPILSEFDHAHHFFK